MINSQLCSEIKKNLKINSHIITVDVTESTNTNLKKLAENGAEEWTVLCADKQTKGKGRTGNSFYSPENGIYPPAGSAPASPGECSAGQGACP